MDAEMLYELARLFAVEAALVDDDEAMHLLDTAEELLERARDAADDAA